MSPNLKSLLKHGFDDEVDLIAALEWTPPKTAAQIKRARVKTRVKVRRWRHRRAKQAAEAKTFVKRSIEGSAARARPHCAGGRNFTAPPRWPLLLDIMADGRERTMRELCAAFDRPHPTTSTTLQRRLIARGFAERRRDPNARRGDPILGRATTWLYRITEAGAAYVAAKAVETPSEIDA